MKSYLLDSIAFIDFSVTSKADISGLRSYVSTRGDGTKVLCSLENSFSVPPLKK